MPIPSLPEVRQKAIIALVPFFASRLADIDVALFKQVSAKLDGYEPTTPREVQLAAESIAYSIAGGTCARAGLKALRVSCQDMMAWKDIAIPFVEASLRSEKAIRTGRRVRANNGGTAVRADWVWDDAAFQCSMDHAMEALSAAKVLLGEDPPLAPRARPVPKLKFLMAEPMTPNVLARLRRG